ncbi:MAG TPA: cold-inducible protein YdjO-related protein [Bacillota bacterium]|nr:cold-inducible protein YdjO-related protein [Bacillota bacterium]
MFFNRKKELEPVIEVATDIWSCIEESCLGWARKEFFFAEEPTCPFCESPMISDTRDLPVLYDRLPHQ